MSRFKRKNAEAKNLSLSHRLPADRATRIAKCLQLPARVTGSDKTTTKGTRGPRSQKQPLKLHELMLYGHALILCTTYPVSIIGPIYKGNWIGKYVVTRIMKWRGVRDKKGSHWHMTQS
jgi:hypothetical protein